METGRRAVTVLTLMLLIAAPLGSTQAADVGHGTTPTVTPAHQDGNGTENNTAPGASFAATCTDLACRFDGSGSGDPDGNVTSWAWDFGDGSSGHGDVVNHTYASAGTYTVVLTVTDDDNATGATEGNVSVEAPTEDGPGNDTGNETDEDPGNDTDTNELPFAEIDLSCADLTCKFDGSASYDPDGEIAAWSWTFGDGDDAEGRTVDHTYPERGEYEVILTVADDDGGEASLEITVVVPTHDEPETSPPPGDDEPHAEGPPPECRRYFDAQHERFEDLRREFERRWQALERDWNAGPEDDETHEEFEERMRRRERALHDEERTAFRELEREVHEGAPEACRDPGPAPPDEMPDDVPEECRQIMDEMRRIFEDGEPTQEDRRRIRELEARMEECMRTAHPEAGGERDWEGSWEMRDDRTGSRIIVEGNHVELVGVPGPNVLRDVTVGGETYVAEVDVSTHLLDSSFRTGRSEKGSTLEAHGEGVEVVFHDHPTGLIRMRSDPPEGVYLEIPGDVQVTATETGWELTAGDGHAVVRADSDRSDWDAPSRTLTLRGEAAFLLPDAKHPVDVANENREAISRAAVDGRVGAEITVARSGDAGAAGDTLSYSDEVQVDVAVDEDARRVGVTLSSDITEGRAFVVNVDKDIIPADGSVDVSHVVKEDDRSTEAGIELGESAEAVLTCADADEDAPATYVLVRSKSGVQLLVCIPSWSVHEITVEGAAAMQNPLPSPAGLTVLVILAGAALAAGKRRKT